MKLYGGYNGKRVADKREKKFKLVKSKTGKRLAKKPIEENLIYQTVQLLSGKVQYLFSKIKDLSGYIDYDEMEQKYLEPGQEEEPLLADISLDKYIDLHDDGVRVATIVASSFDDIEDIVYFVKEGCIVVTSYGLLNREARNEFDRRLSIELMQLGTHLTHITKSEIICAGREISVEDNTVAKKEGKIYDLRAIMKR